MSKGRLEISEKSYNEIKTHKEDGQNMAATSKSQMNSELNKQMETERKHLLTQQVEMSRRREDIEKFKSDVVTELQSFETIVTTFVNHDLKKVCKYLF